MTDIEKSNDLEELRSIALAATPGPWNWVGDLSMNEASLESPSEEGYVLSAYGLHTEGFVDVGESDAAFIAAANPATVLALLDRLEAAERELIEKMLDT